MKLQINNSGAWKTVTTFTAADLATVKRHAECLGQMDHEAGCRSTWRVLDDAGQVDWHWNPVRGWVAWAKPGSR